jgi:hypothetical protein
MNGNAVPETICPGIVCGELRHNADYPPVFAHDRPTTAAALYASGY